MNFLIRIRKHMYHQSLKGGRSDENLHARAKKKGKASALLTERSHRFRLWIVKKGDTTSQQEFLY